jgi:hypothetical protein
MYTVNYGGSVGQPQMEWLDRELARSRLTNEDVTILMHHDPRNVLCTNGCSHRDSYKPRNEFRAMHMLIIQGRAKNINPNHRHEQRSGSRNDWFALIRRFERAHP